MAIDRKRLLEALESASESANRETSDFSDPITEHDIRETMLVYLNDYNENVIPITRAELDALYDELNQDTKQTATTGVNAFFNTWPGDETEAELMEMMKDVCVESKVIAYLINRMREVREMYESFRPSTSNRNWYRAQMVFIFRMASHLRIEDEELKITDAEREKFQEDAK